MHISTASEIFMIIPPLAPRCPLGRAGSPPDIIGEWSLGIGPDVFVVIGRAILACRLHESFRAGVLPFRPQAFLPLPLSALWSCGGRGALRY